MLEGLTFQLPQVVDNLAGVKQHIDRIDWQLPAALLTPDYVTKQFIGHCGYWRLPQFAGMEPAQIEIEILKAIDPAEWGGRSPWKPYYQHFLTLLKLLCPGTDITPNLADTVMFFMYGLSNNRKGLNLIGSQNSGKSSMTARMAMTCMAINPDLNFVLVVNPRKNTAQSTIWGDFTEVYNEMSLTAPWLWPEARVFADKRIVLKKVPKAGYVEIRPADEIGKFKGTKTKKVKCNGRYITPLFLIVVDEVNEIKSTSFLDVFSNLISQDGFNLITSQNFRTESDMGGRLTEPDGKTFGGPNAFDELNKTMRWWHSFSSTVTLRFNGLWSPNILAGRDIYPYLFKMQNLVNILLTYKENSPEYYSQVLSYPIESVDLRSVVSSSVVKRARLEDQFYTVRKYLGKVAFGDPAFGGGDLCLFGWVEVAQCDVAGPDGSKTSETLIICKHQFRRMKLDRDMVVDDDWLTRCAKVSTKNPIKISHYVRGAPVPLEDQIAMQYAEHCMENEIAFSNFGYDFSMRHEIMTSVTRIMGMDPVAFGYNEPPKGFFLNGLKKNSTDVCGDRVSELAFMAADVIQAKQLRGEFLLPGMTQLARTLFAERGVKRFVEKKEDYKKRWTGVSPDARDVLLGLIGMAARLGLVLNNPLTPSKGSANSPANQPVRPLKRGVTLRR